MRQKSLCMCVEMELGPESPGPEKEVEPGWEGRLTTQKVTNYFFCKIQQQPPQVLSVLAMSSGLQCAARAEVSQGSLTQGEAGLSSPRSTRNAPPSARSQKSAAPDPAEDTGPSPPDMAD